MAQIKLMVSAPEAYIIAAGENVNVSDESEWGHNPGTFGKKRRTDITARASGSFISFMERCVVRLADAGRSRTSETYRSALRSFSVFCGHRRPTADDINASLIEDYENYLVRRGLSPNTTSFYMRVLRAAYNSAVISGLTVQRSPFVRVYTGIGRTVKRAVPIPVISRIKNLDLSGKPSFELTRDLFMFSFYTRGMSFVDMAYLCKNDLKDGVLSYGRHKTGRRLNIKWEKCMQDIVDRYSALTGDTPFLLPILKDSKDKEVLRRSYCTALRWVNRNLKKLGELAGCKIPLTTYVARHTWASTAYARNIPVAVISEGLGHESEKTTRVYLKSLDDDVINRANASIIDALK